MKELSSFRAFLELEKRRSAHTVIAYCQDIEQCFHYLNQQYLVVAPSAVTAVMVRSWAVLLMEQGMASTTIRRKMSSLKAFYKFLQRRQGLAQNPVTSVTLPRKGKRIPTYIPARAMEQFLDRLPGEGSFEAVRDRLILNMLYETGMRRSELLGLTPDRIDLARKQLQVLGKRNKERIIPIGDGLVERIREYNQLKESVIGPDSGSTFFLTAEGRPLSVRSLYSLVNTYLQSIGQLEKRSPHVLRHTFATHLAESGADLQAIRSLLGHSTLASTQVYTHTQIGQLKKTYLQAHPRSRVNSGAESLFTRKNS